VELPADPRRGNLRLYGSGYKPFDSLSSLGALWLAELAQGRPGRN